MSRAESTVSVKLTFDLAPGGDRGLERGTAAVERLARAERELGRSAADAGRAVGDRYRALSRAEAAADLVRSQAVPLADRPGRVQARLRGPDLYAELAGELAERKRVQGEYARFMAARGLTPGGDRRPAERGLVGRGLEAFGDRLGLSPGVAGAVGTYAPLAAPLVAGKIALDQAVQARQIDATPFLTPGAAREQKLRNLPLGAGRLYGYAEDARAALSGDLDAIRASEEYRVTETAKARLAGEAGRARDAYRAEAGGLRGRADAYDGLRLDRRTSTGRESAADARRYDEEGRLLPARQRLTVATRDRAAAERNVADALQQQAVRERELEAARERYDSAEAKRQGQAGRIRDVQDVRDDMRRAAARNLANAAAGGVIGLAGGMFGGDGDGYSRARLEARAAEADKAKEQLDQAQGRADDARNRTDRRRRELAEANSAERQAGVGVTREELGIAREREGQARQGADALGGLGPAGRQRALVALQGVQSLGVDNVSREMLSLAESVAPETVGKLKAAAGERYKEEFRRLAPDESGFKPTDEAARRVDRLEERGLRGTETDLARTAREMAGTLDETAKAMEDALTAIISTLQKMKADAQRAAGNASVR